MNCFALLKKRFRLHILIIFPFLFSLKIGLYLLAAMPNELVRSRTKSE